MGGFFVFLKISICFVIYYNMKLKEIMNTNNLIMGTLIINQQ